MNCEHSNPTQYSTLHKQAQSSMVISFTDLSNIFEAEEDEDLNVEGFNLFTYFLQKKILSIFLFVFYVGLNLNLLKTEPYFLRRKRF